MSDLPQSPQDLAAIYRHRFAGKQEYRLRVWSELVERVFAAWIPETATVLDLGCGYCEFINHVHAGRKFGMDLNPDAIRHAGADVTILPHDCSQAWPLPNASLDTVFTSNFFEHLPSKKHLEETLGHIFRALKPGGRLIAMGPNIRCVPGAYWDFFDHHIPLTDRSLAEALEKNGFSLGRMIPRFLPYTVSNHSEYPVALLRLYLMLPLFWPFFGHQFLIVAKKP